MAATLVHKALGDRLHCVFVDNGLLRYQVGWVWGSRGGVCVGSLQPGAGLIVRRRSARGRLGRVWGCRRGGKERGHGSPGKGRIGANERGVGVWERGTSGRRAANVTGALVVRARGKAGSGPAFGNAKGCMAISPCSSMLPYHGQPEMTRRSGLPTWFVPGCCTWPGRTRNRPRQGGWWAKVPRDSYAFQASGALHMHHTLWVVVVQKALRTASRVANSGPLQVQVFLQAACPCSRYIQFSPGPSCCAVASHDNRALFEISSRYCAVLGPGRALGLA